MSDMLVVKDLTVRFGGVNALDGLSFSVRAGEIHGIIGPNGAGKTTAINALTGFVPRVRGEIHFNGVPVPRSPHQVTKLGITRTFQTPATFPGLTAVENVMSGGDKRQRAGMLRVVLGTKAARGEESAARTAALDLLERVGFTTRPDTPVTELSFGEHRKVEIARALMFDPQLLFLDEPTAGLTGEEVHAVALLLREVIDQSPEPMSIVLVEHNVPLVFSLSDTVTAFADGAAIASGTPAEVRATESVIKSYLGGEVGEVEPSSAPPGSAALLSTAAVGARSAEISAEPVLVVRGLRAGYGSITALRDIDMTVNKGELVLVYGRNGAGKSTLLNSIAGLPRPSQGEVLLQGVELHRRSVSNIVRSGLALVPQERGVIASLSVNDNLRLGTSGTRIDRAEFQRRRAQLFDRFPVLERRRKQLAGTLSGGERQMLALAKVLIRQPQVLLLDEPSIGLAPTIVKGLQDIVQQIRDDGISVVVAEQNVWWVAPMASRAYLLEDGRIVAQGLADEVIKRESLILSYLGHEASEAVEEARSETTGDRK